MLGADAEQALGRARVDHAVMPGERGAQLDLPEGAANQARRVLLHERVRCADVDRDVALGRTLDRSEEHPRGVARVDVGPEAARADSRIGAAAATSAANDSGVWIQGMRRLTAVRSLRRVAAITMSSVSCF